jgi:hypothetical protein
MTDHVHALFLMPLSGAHADKEIPVGKKCGAELGRGGRIRPSGDRGHGKARTRKFGGPRFRQPSVGELLDKRFLWA